MENVMAESIKRGKANVYALDGLVFDGTSPGPRYVGQSWPAVRIAIEAKIQSGQVKKLIRRINECIERGPHERDAHPEVERSDHAKFQGIVEWKPAYFL